MAKYILAADSLLEGSRIMDDSYDWHLRRHQQENSLTEEVVTQRTTSHSFVKFIYFTSNGGVLRSAMQE